MTKNFPKLGPIALAALLSVFQIACDSVPTQSGPGAHDGAGPALRSIDAPPPTTNLGPVAVPVAATSAEVWDVPTVHIPAYSRYVISVQGTVTLVSNPKVVECFGAQYHSPPYGEEGTYGPEGVVGYYDELKVSLNRGYIGLRYSPDINAAATTDTSWTWTDIDVYASRKGVGSGIGQGGNPGCESLSFYLYSGGQTVSASLIDGPELSLEPRYVLVKKGKVVRFTGRWSTGAVTISPNWAFFPVPGTVDNRTDGCGLGGPNPCDVAVWNDGELRIANWLEPGGMRGARATLRTYSTFELQSDKSQVDPNETVQFTPMIDGAPGQAVRWLWRADDKTEIADPCSTFVDHRCLYAPASSGTMWAYTSGAAGDADSASARVQAGGPPSELVLTANKTEIFEGETVTFVGELVPPTSSYQVIGWSWRSDDVIVAARAPRVAPVRSAAAAPASAASANSVKPPKSKQNGAFEDITASEDIADAGPEPRPEPEACRTTTLTCAIPIAKAGTMTLRVAVNGTVKERSVHVKPVYACPDRFPIPMRVFDGGDVVVQAQERGRFTGRPMGSHTITMRGPWKKTSQDPVYVDGFPKARYIPKQAFDDVGHSVFDESSTYAEFWCRAILRDFDVSTGLFEYDGSMKYAGHMQVNWFNVH